jgi:hypothetical protein
MRGVIMDISEISNRTEEGIGLTHSQLKKYYQIVYQNEIKEIKMK